jgi:hypothetical protein
MSIVKALNENLGVLIAAGIIALATNSILGYANDARIEQRMVAVEQFAAQQRIINDTQIKISESVAVMAARMNYVEKDLDRVFANTPARP